MTGDENQAAAHDLNPTAYAVVAPIPEIGAWPGDLLMRQGNEYVLLRQVSEPAPVERFGHSLRPLGSAPAEIDPGPRPQSEP